MTSLIQKIEKSDINYQFEDRLVLIDKIHSEVQELLVRIKQNAADEAARNPFGSLREKFD